MSQTDTDGRGHTEQLNSATTWLLFVAKVILCRAKRGGETQTETDERERKHDRGIEREME